MGRKKRNAVGATGGAPKSDAEPRLNPIEPPAKADYPAVEKQPDYGGVDAPSFAKARVECERALVALRRGNHSKALRLIKEACQRNENSPHYALVLRAQGTVFSRMAAVIDDPIKKTRYLKSGLEAARRAAELVPDSIEFCHFCASLLHDVAIDAKEFEEAVKECDRGLAIQNPIDPAKCVIPEEGQQKALTAEARIEQVQNDMRNLIQKSNISSISSWMKNLGNGDDTFRLIPLRRLDDPMEMTRLVQARKPNEIKRAIKTPAERRKEIEVRVAAARIIQKNGDVQQLKIESDSSAFSAPRVSERRKSSINARKKGSSSERRDFVRAFWDSTSDEAKRDLLQIKVSDMKELLGLSKDGSANKVFSEALLFAETKRTWKFWDCCRCDERSADSVAYIHHIVSEHMETLLPKLQATVPDIVDDGWAEMLLNGSWKPFDTLASIKMLLNPSKGKEIESVDDFCLADHVGDFNESIKGRWDSSAEKGNCTDYNSKNTDHEKGSVPHSMIESWPVCDDSERAKLLEKIHSVFEVLIKHKCLAGSHLTKVIQYTINEIQSIPSGSLLLNHGIDQTPTRICFLGDAQLRNILKFLQDLSVVCGFGRHPDKNSNAIEDANTVNRITESTPNIVLSADSSVLLLDEDLLSAESNSLSVDSGGLLSWIFGGPTSGEELSSWECTKKEKKSKGLELLQMIEKEFYHLQNLCEQKCEHLSYEEAWQAIDDLCAEERRQRENTEDFLHQSLDSVLKQRREELLEKENDEMFPNSRVESDAITRVLKEAENSSVNQYGLQETYGGMNSRICDLESGEGEDWRAKDYLQQVDNCIEAALRAQKENLYIELSKVDAKLLRSVSIMQQSELRLAPISAHDFRLILLPLVKSYLRAHLEDLADKYATEKSDAMRESLLAELDRDSVKAAKAGDNARQSQEKTKDKKKQKDNKRPKDSKVTGVSSGQSFPDEDDEWVYIPGASDGYDPDSEIDVSAKTEDFERREAERRRKSEAEEEERMLQETMDYQRRMENEAKLKRVSEQNKKASLEKAMKQIDGFRLYKHFKPSIHEDSSNNSNRTDYHSSSGVKSSDVSTAQTSSEHQTKIQEGSGLSNGGVADDSHSHVDRRSGKKGRRQKNSPKLNDRQSPVFSSPKGSVEIESSDPETGLKEGGNEATALRQLQAEDDDEERFQAEIKKALQVSRDFHAHTKIPSSVSSSPTLPRISGGTDSDEAVMNKGQVSNEKSDGDVIGAGLSNEVGEYNCFLNVIIQSLWNIKRFRDEVMLRSTLRHTHVGDPCVVCALYDIFCALNVASSADTRREAVAPNCLRTALGSLNPQSRYFQEAQMNDASEVLEVIFKSLHQSFAPSSGASDTKSVSNKCSELWDCENKACIAHSIFGMDIFERMYCSKCKLESRHLKYTSFFHNINASALRTMKAMCPDSPFEELLNLVEMNHQLACDPEAGGCGKLNYIHHILQTPPHIFTTVVGWQNARENVYDIKSTLEALDTEIDISDLYSGLDPKTKHALVSVVCYYGQHYHCFAYSRDNGKWIMYDDKTVKVIGSWADVLAMCEKGHLQPQLLFFESVN